METKEKRAKRRADGMSLASLGCGIGAFLISGCSSVTVCCSLVGLVPAVIAIALAILSRKGAGGKMPTPAKIGLGCGIVAIMLNVVLVIGMLILAFVGGLGTVGILGVLGFYFLQ